MDIQRIRSDFPMLNGKTMQSHPLIYLDNAATTFKPYCVLDAIAQYYTDMTSNAHRGDYDLSYQVDHAFEGARARVASFLHAQPKEIVFTSGASEGLNLVAQGYGSMFLQAGDIVLTSESEHASCVLPWMKVCEERRAQLQFIRLREDGRIDMEYLRSIMSERVKVITLAMISNVLGYEAPIAEICALAHAYGAIVVADGAQSVPHMPIDVQALDCDFLSFSAHKLCGPTGIGALYGKYALLDAMMPLHWGGGSNARYDMCGNILLKDPPFKFESGTPNIEGVLGMKAAIDYLETIGMDEIHAHEQMLHRYIIDGLMQMDHIIVYNADCEGAIITFNVKDVFAQDAATYFNANGIAVRSGQHCAKLLLDYLDTSATVRASLYFYNTMEEADRFLAVCANANMQSCLDVYF